MPEKSDIRAAWTLGLADFGLLAHRDTVVKSIADPGLATAVTASMAHWLGYRATRRASAAAIAPAAYAQIIAVTPLAIVWSGHARRGSLYSASIWIIAAGPVAVARASTVPRHQCAQLPVINHLFLDFGNAASPARRACASGE